MNRPVYCIALSLLALAFLSPQALAGGTPGGAHTEVMPDETSALTPEEKMNRRFPQKVRVGDLIGLPLYDADDRTLGYVSDVIRTNAGKIQLISSCCGYFSWGSHPVAVPIEVVAILARHINVLDISRRDFLGLPSWSKDAQSVQIDPDDMIRIAISRR